MEASICWLSTPMLSASRLIFFMSVYSAVLGYAADSLIDAAEVNHCVRRRLVRAVHFGGRRAHGGQCRVGCECSKCGDFRGTRAADAPGLLEDSRAPSAVAVTAPRDIVIAPRCDQSIVCIRCCAVINAGL